MQILKPTAAFWRISMILFASSGKPDKLGELTPAYLGFIMPEFALA
jgi:hypothetical protein